MTFIELSRSREHLLSDVVAGILATASFGSSLRHVQTVATSHGQHGLISWTIAISVELVALVAILELRRARGQQRMPVAAVIALAAGLAMSAGANLATATGRGFGWSQVVAVWPAIAYVLVAVIIETRPPKATPGTTVGGAHDTTPTDATPRHDRSVDITGEMTEHDTAPPVDEHPQAKAQIRLHAVPPPQAAARRANIPPRLLGAVLAGDLTQAAAAEQAGVSVRTLQRHLDAERARRTPADEGSK